MKNLAVAFTFILVISVLQALVEQPRSVALKNPKGGPDGVFLPAESTLSLVASAAPISQETSSCTNCLIKRCLVSGSVLTGYCLEGARGGICHTAYDPTHCPAGKPALSKVSRQCGPSVFTVDNMRTCQ